MFFKILSFGIVFLVCACVKKQEHRSIVIGHAGAGLGVINGTYSDNSKEAITYAMSFVGCEGVEIDVQLSKDTTAWLLHDLTLNNSTDSEGCVGEKSDHELSNVRYKSLIKESLVELTSIDFEGLNTNYLWLDLRHYQVCDEKYIDNTSFITALQKNTFIQNNLTKVILISNQLNWLMGFQNSFSQLVYEVESVSQAIALKNEPKIYGFIIKNKNIEKDQVKELRAAGKKVAIFELRSVKGIRSAFKKAPDFIITDDIRTTLIEK